jgi:hypothetical protein
VVRLRGATRGDELLCCPAPRFRPNTNFRDGIIESFTASQTYPGAGEDSERVKREEEEQRPS